MLRIDRFVLGVSGAVVLLILIAVGSVALAQRRDPARVVDATPTGVVYNYLAALEREDYDTAYTSLSSSTHAWLSLDDFRRRGPRGWPRRPSGAPSSSVALSDERIDEDNARVTLTITTFSPGGPFGGGDEFTDTEVMELRREGGAWKIDVGRDMYYRLYPAGF